MMRVMAWIAVVALSTAGCTASSGAASGTTEASPGSTGRGTPSSSVPFASGLRPVTPVPGSPSAGGASLSPAIVDPIVAEAAALAGVPVSAVTVVMAEPVTWPDAGLGCPMPGVVYPQVQVDGYQVIVQAGPATYDYRGSGPGTFRRCTNPA